MKALLSSFLLITFLSVKGQQSAGIQQYGMRVDAAEIKIDGEISEWGHQLNWYNETCEIYYSIGNDFNYLFLAVQVKDKEIINKLISGGLAFTINPGGNKKDKNSVVITFPVYEKGKSHPYLALDKITEIKPGAANYNKLRDSLQNAGEKQLKASFKFIGTTGMKDVAEDMISIYNDKGIQAAGTIDNSLYYNFELSVPLKLLNISTASKSVAYNIRLNGPASRGTNLRVERDRFLVFDGSDGKRYMMGDATPRNWSLASPTDFWGGYTLEK